MELLIPDDSKSWISIRVLNLTSHNAPHQRQSVHLAGIYPTARALQVVTSTNLIPEADLGIGAPSCLGPSMLNPDMMTLKLIPGRDETEILSP